MYICFLGMPGSGKGTQSKRISEYLNLPHLSIGDVMRNEITTQSNIGKKITEIIELNSLLIKRKNSIEVFEHLAIEIITEKLKQADYSRGVILDGFPRTIYQAESINKIIGRELCKVVFLKINNVEEIYERIMNRLTCTSCGEIYSLIKSDIKYCTQCNSRLDIRMEDNIDIVRNRLEEYHLKTVKLISYYKEKNILIEVDGSEEENKVFSNIRTKIKRG
ncbi:adenylate kinase family protein [Sutcliffiella horikoshii]|uniref:adenylate kinase family protein n=1 Tax=Sutcliffiella horikoshii TaxID=79883 RepID=UPI003CF43A1F